MVIFESKNTVVFTLIDFDIDFIELLEDFIELFDDFIELLDDFLPILVIDY